MSDLMTQIGQYEWGINTVCTAQVNQTRADAKVTVTDTKKRKGLHETNMWQHNELPLVFAAWSNNAVVKSLSNFRSPIIIPNGVQ